MPESALPITAAATSPSTLRNLLRRKPEPKLYWMNHAVSTASPALQKAKKIDPQRFRSPRRFATTVAAIVPATTAHPAGRPRQIGTRAPPLKAAKKTATPSGLVRKARLSLAAKK